MWTYGITPTAVRFEVWELTRWNRKAKGSVRHHAFLRFLSPRSLGHIYSRDERIGKMKWFTMIMRSFKGVGYEHGYRHPPLWTGGKKTQQMEKKQAKRGNRRIVVWLNSRYAACFSLPHNSLSHRNESHWDKKPKRCICVSSVWAKKGCGGLPWPVHLHPVKQLHGLQTSTVTMLGCYFCVVRM